MIRTMSDDRALNVPIHARARAVKNQKSYFRAAETLVAGVTACGTGRWARGYLDPHPHLDGILFFTHTAALDSP